MMMKTLAPIVVALTTLAAHTASAAGFSVLVDHSSRLPVVGAGSVIVGNPNVADVTVVDSQTVYVSGRASGSTNIIVLDKLGRPVFTGDVDVIQAGSPVAVFHGVERTDFTCAQNCSKNDKPFGANPLSAQVASAATTAHP